MPRDEVGLSDAVLRLEEGVGQIRGHAVMKPGIFFEAPPDRSGERLEFGEGFIPGKVTYIINCDF